MRKGKISKRRKKNKALYSYKKIYSSYMIDAGWCFEYINFLGLKSILRKLRRIKRKHTHGKLICESRWCGVDDLIIEF